MSRTWFKIAYDTLEPHFGSSVQARVVTSLATNLVAMYHLRLQPVGSVVQKLASAGLLKPIMNGNELRAAFFTVAVREQWDARMAAELLGEEQEL